MTYLFTKKGCLACEDLKSNPEIQCAKDLTIFSLDEENPEALALLAYYECVALSEKQLPLLVSDTRQVVTGPIAIERYIKENCC